MSTYAVLMGTDAAHLTQGNGDLLPILQVVYAETLRLRMHFYIIRMPDRTEINTRDWILPRRKVVVTPTTAAHKDPEVRNTILNNEPSVDRFWIGGFLRQPSKLEYDTAQSQNTAFSLVSLEWSWIPYGGEPQKCLDRLFAKRQILLTSALMGFGSGMSHPAGKVPMRIRRRS
ncbi:hypothetical protein N8I77_013050 [Diaporthe amygdali]|uniref:Uncharacterized protein n=1 Tax=Phomopsis amygdali TaxID=1214568 RepID=A0AAD9S3I6_PHOAM|nr:hypothetical protein N8I77_013050 [Diaporthe amygdali]